MVLGSNAYRYFKNVIRKLGEVEEYYSCRFLKLCKVSKNGVRKNHKEKIG